VYKDVNIPPIFMTVKNDREAWRYPVKTGGNLTKKASKVSGAAALGAVSSSL
jgi:hypothetical protein